MLINEIIKLDEPIVVKKEFDVSKLGPFIGRGAFAEVYKGKHPNTVIKVARIGIGGMESAYLDFVRTAMKHQDNPFFPRIYNAKLYITPRSRDPDKPNIFVVEMEKLFPLTHDMIIESGVSLLNQMGIKTTERISSDRLSHKLEQTFVSSNKRQKLMNTSTNSLFVQALEAMEPLFQKHLVDTQAANWMVRLTGQGPHIVITDPVAD